MQRRNEVKGAGQRIFIGIDGGGTKSIIRVEDAAGMLLGQVQSGPANIRLSSVQAWDSIYAGLQQILQPLNISLTDPTYQFYAVMGLAGSELAVVNEAFSNTPHPFTCLELVSDAHIACLAAHGGHEGAIIIIGTGTVGYQIYSGKTEKVSGWGFPYDDPGSGAWLGFQAIQLVLRSLDQRIRADSELLTAVFKKFDQRPERLLTWLQTAASTQFAELAPLVLAHAEQNDPWALLLMRNAAQEIEQIAKALATTAPELPCALVGGLASFIEPYLSEQVQKRLVPCVAEPCMGAMALARRSV